MRPEAPAGWRWDHDGDLVRDSLDHEVVTIVCPEAEVYSLGAIGSPWGVERTHQWAVVLHTLRTGVTVLTQFDTPEAAIACLVMAYAQELYK